MNCRSFLLLIAGVVVGLNSCKKDVPENNGVIGKWRLAETYFGYLNGGDFQWNPVPAENAHTLQFTANGQYNKVEKINGASQQCSGTYQLLPVDSIQINSNCQPGVERIKISELTNRSLIFDYQVREGIVRYKYAVEK